LLGVIEYTDSITDLLTKVRDEESFSKLISEADELKENLGDLPPKLEELYTNLTNLKSESENTDLLLGVFPNDEQLQKQS
jgi:uncharacterized coiled-coil DUF342 family protein